MRFKELSLNIGVVNKNIHPKGNQVEPGRTHRWFMRNLSNPAFISLLPCYYEGNLV